MSDAEFLNGRYYIQSELGSGGFGKVKLGTHLLTGEQVAIKIIDKKAIGSDFFRVRIEIDVLKTLSHQNICRMFEYYETEHKCYIIMEYCDSGEMFDHIVRKERLEETEARFFFRQLLQAMAYAHSLGICHRDLKPENLMLTSDSKLKLIDFGLSSRPKSGLTHSLQTCCGSPAYAAPEIIEHSKYYGHEIDIWSMGVLLYVLLCGVLPFEDENLARLYKKIRAGVYHEPAYLSPLSKDVLKQMLQVNPRHRITMKDLLEHKWVTKSYNMPVKWHTVYDKNNIDQEVALEMAFYSGISTQKMVNQLKQWKYDYYTATYLILLRRKELGLKFALPMYRSSNQIEHVLHSPTIHKSLENDLDRIECDYGGKRNSERDGISDSSTGAVACVNFLRSPHQRTPLRKPDPTATPILSARQKNRMNKDLAFMENKENFASLRIRAPIRLDAGDRTSVHGTPRRPGIPIMGSANQASMRKPRAYSSERQPKPSAPLTPEHRTPKEEVTPTSLSSQTPELQVTPRYQREGRSKASQLPRRVCASLERSGARLKNLLTPKKLSTNKDSPMVLNLQTGTNFANLSVTSSNDCHKVREELIRVLLEQKLSVNADKWTLSGKDSSGRVETIVELEIVWIDTLKMVGVRRRRLTGDAIIYKKICEQVLALAGL
uniref:non-specific serine/threonine protein kinase n=1 Tax=Panagrolaimus superbus TaxID=310955 RepID=A0A914YC53_9BILA